MNLNLFSLNLLLTFAMLFAALVVFVLAVQRYYRRYKKLSLLVACSLAGAGAVQLACHWFFPGEMLPLLFGMSLPLATSITLLVLSWKASAYLRVVNAAAILVALIFGCLLVNNYYQYYPHLRDVLHRNDRTALEARAAQSVVVRYGAINTIPHKTSIEETIQELPDMRPDGQIYNVTIPSTVSGFKNRGARVYVPPVSFNPQKVDLPVIILLAGMPGTPDDWILGGGVESTMNAYAHQHHGVTPLVFVVDDLGSQFNDTECVDSPRGNVETYLTVDVPNYIKSQFDVKTDPASWAIGGLSDGGMCGIMLTLRHPDVYRHFLDFGGELGPDLGSEPRTIKTLFGGSADAWQKHQPTYLLQNQDYTKGTVGGYFAVGKSDSFAVTNAILSLYKLSASKGLDVAYESIDGKHTFDVWKQAFRDSVPWASYHLGATNCTANCY